jgi:hypothetical protein
VTFAIGKFDAWWNVASGFFSITLMSSTGGSTSYHCTFSANNVATKGIYILATTANPMGDGGSTDPTTVSGCDLYSGAVDAAIDSFGIMLITVTTRCTTAPCSGEFLVSGQVTMGHSTIASFA